MAFFLAYPVVSLSKFIIRQTDKTDYFMKRFILAAAAMVFCSLLAEAQSEEGKNDNHNIFVQQSSPFQLYSEPVKTQETLVSKKTYGSGYGAVSTQYSKFDHEDAMFLG